MRSSSAMMSMMAGAVTSDSTAQRTANGPAAAAHVEARVDAVGIAALLAQEPVEPGVEEAAEQCVHDRHGVEVVDDAEALPTWPTRISDCGAPGRSISTTRRPGAALIRIGGPAAAPRSVRGPATEDARDDVIVTSTPSRSPHTMSVAAAGRISCRMAFDERRRDRGPRPSPRCHRVGVRRRQPSAKMTAGIRPLGAASRVGHGLLQVVDALVAQPLDLCSGKAGLQGQLGEQRQRLGQARPWHLDVRPPGCPSRHRRPSRHPAVPRPR